MSRKPFSKLLLLSLALMLGTSIMTLPTHADAAAKKQQSKRASTANVDIPEETPYVKRQLRAAWVASVTNIDWPSKKGLSEEKQRQEFIKILDESKEMGMNAVIVQIRPTSDSFYPSKYMPWSEYLTGTQGKSPGYDPLEFMIKEAHRRNLEFHAWFNPYRISMKADLNALVEDHPARKHPEWVVSYGGKLYYNPGIPEAKDFVIKAIMEAVEEYDIDAVHLDDYFYPYKVAGEEFQDEETYQRYGADKFADKNDWRRNNIDTFVKELSEAIKKEKKHVKFGISPFAVWRNKAVDDSGSDTKAGQTTYDDLYADTRKWVREEWVDYITPQIYWNFGFEPAAYEKVLDWWLDETEGKDLHLYVGQAVYKINKNNEAWENPEEMPNQLKYNATIDRVNGSMFFSAKDLRNNELGITDRLKEDLYKYPALVPASPWIDDDEPKKPKLKEAEWEEDGIALEWEDHKQNDDTTYYVIYRFAGDKKGDLEDAANILTTVRKTGKTKQTFVDETAETGEVYTYVITSVSRLHNESDESNSITVKKDKQ